MRRRSALALILSTALMSAVAQQSAFDPTSTSGPLRTGRGLTFCLDQQNPAWAFEKDLATAVAKSLGRPVDFYMHRTPLPDLDSRAQPLDRTELLRLFAHRCDVYPGLVGSTTPAFDYPADEQMYATRPYLKVSYLFVSRVPGVTSLSQLPKTAPLSMDRGGLPAYMMYTLRKGLFTDRAVTSPARLVSDLLTGKATAGLVFAPQLYARQPDLGKVNLSAAPITELPNMTWYVIYGVRRDRPSLRGELDSAIRRLIQKGDVQKLLAKHNLNRPGVEAAAVDAGRPKSESYDDKR